MAQLNLPNTPIPDINKGKNDLYKALGQFLGMSGGMLAAKGMGDARDEEMRDELNKLLNPNIPPDRTAPIEAAQYSKEQAEDPDVIKKVLSMEKPSIGEIEGIEGPAATKTLPAFKEYIPKGTSRRTMEGLQDDMLKNALGIGGARAPLSSKLIQGPGPDGKPWWFKPDPSSETGYSPVMPIAAMPQTFKERVKGDSTRNPEEEYQVETFDTSGKAGVTMRKKEVPGRVMPAIKSTPDAEIQKGIIYDTMLGNIGRIESTISDEWVGPAAGRYYGTKEALAGLNNPDQVAFYADTRDLGDMLLRARSGAAITEDEYARLSKLVPTPNLPPDVFRARLARFKDQLIGAMKSQQKRLTSGGYLPGPPDPAPKPQSPATKEDLSTLSDEELLRRL